MTKANTRTRTVAFLGVMGSLMIFLAIFQAFNFFPITDLESLKLLFFFQMLSLGITELCVAWLIHIHSRS